MTIISLLFKTEIISLYHYVLSFAIMHCQNLPIYLINDHCLISIHYQQVLLKINFLPKSEEFRHNINFIHFLEESNFYSSTKIYTLFGK